MRRPRERGAGVECWVEEEGEGLAAAGCGCIRYGRLGGWVSVEAAAVPAGVQISLRWFQILLPKAVWF